MSMRRKDPESPGTSAIPRFIRLTGLLLVLFTIIVVLLRFVQFVMMGDPPLVDLVQTDGFMWLQGIPSLIAAVFFLLGITGLYLRQADESGLFGLASYIFAFFAVTLSAGAMWTYAFTAPIVAREAPALLTDASHCLIVAVLGSMLIGQVGWLLMGISALRANVIPKWASLILIASVLLVIAMAPLATTQLYRLAYNTLLGVGPITIGYVLWRDKIHAPPPGKLQAA